MPLNMSSAMIAMPNVSSIVSMCRSFLWKTRWMKRRSTRKPAGTQEEWDEQQEQPEAHAARGEA